MSYISTASSPISSQRNTQPLVLVVEDDPILRDLVKTILTEEISCQVIAASCSQAALQQVAGHTAMNQLPELLLFDYQIGLGMTGIDLYDQLQLLPGWATIPAILMSANLPHTHIQARGLKSLPKPFEVDDLLRAVEAMLGEHRFLREDTV